MWAIKGGNNIDEYKEKLFLMVRDYSHQVPEEYRAEHQGYMIDYTSKECNCNDLRNWFY